MNDKAAQVKQVTDAMIKKIADRVCSALEQASLPEPGPARSEVIRRLVEGAFREK